jgi:hypothetical protein
MLQTLTSVIYRFAVTQLKKKKEESKKGTSKITKEKNLLNAKNTTPIASW